MNYTKTLHKDTRVYTSEALDGNDKTAFTLARGHQRERRDGTIDRWVHLAVRAKGHHGPMLYFSTGIGPDEARSLAAMLLDAADDADERMG